MTSLTEARRKLPGEFVAILESLFSPLTIDRIVSAMIAGRPVSLRVNALKADAATVRARLSAAGLKFENTAWYRDAFVLPDATERDVEKTDLYTDGRVYLQGLSSMVPVLVLAPGRGEKILDLTAAPGSKTTQIAAMTGNAAEIVACEMDRLRFERLKYNVGLQAAGSVTLLNLPAEKLIQRHPEYAGYFDRVLLDAPCSGEGRFLVSNRGSYKYWSLQEVRKYSNLQKKLLKSAADSLRPGGILVYSTCTLNTAENEEAVDHAVRNLGMAALDILLKIHGSLPGFCEGFDPSVRKAMRILPGKLMEGFFVCKLQKP